MKPSTVAVTITTSNNRCILSNGILTMEWNEDASVARIERNGVELFCNTPERSDTNGKRGFFIDYHAEGAFHKMNVKSLEIIEATDEIAHVAYIDNTGYLSIEYHIVLLQGQSGYYSYVIGGNNTDAPFELSEFRIVYRCGMRVFDHACNNERMGLQPSKDYMAKFEKLQDETYRLPDGELYSNSDVYSKYDYAGYFSKNPAWGQYGHGYGFFVIPVSTEYYPGGPLKQELLVHYDGILLNYFTGSHFGCGNLHVPVGWKKCYGPFYQYFNEGDDGEALYADALKTAAEEKLKWPYTWVNHPLYPIDRSKVTGKLEFEDGTPCRDTTVLLGKNDLTFERQSAGYLFYTTTDDNGCFTLENVRKDDYTLFAYQTGGSNTHQLEVPINVTESLADLGTITWKLPKRNLIWQLGTATRTCEGFRYAGELRNYKWMGMVPKTLDFYIGKNNPKDDWYYAQTLPDSNWQVHFELDKLPEKDCIITIALAGTCKSIMTNKQNAILYTYLNDNEISCKVFINDSSIYRSSTTNGRYRRFEINVPASLLKKGENILSFRNVDSMVMYDTVLMESLL